MEPFGWTKEIERISAMVTDKYMTPEKATAIGALWTWLNPKRVLEVGTFHGTGACYLGAMAACYRGSVITVDLPWTGEPNKHFSVLAEEQLAKCDVTNVQVIRCEGGAGAFLLKHFKHGDPPYDFIYIDAGHEWTHTAAQYAMCIQAVKPGGWLCFDDLNSTAYPGVDLVWKQLVVPRHDNHYQCGNLGFVRR